MKIAFISFEYPPDTADGGICTYVAEATKMLAERGHQVEVFASSRQREGVEETPWGVRVHRVLEPDHFKFPARIGAVFASRHREVGFELMEGPDYYADASEAVKLAPDVPLVVKLHTTRQQAKEIEASLIPPLRRFRIWLGAARRGQKVLWSPFHPDYIGESEHVLAADEVAAPSEAIGRRAVRVLGLPEERLSCYPYPFTPRASHLEIPPGSRRNKLVTFVGRLEIRKGVIDLVRAIPAIVKARPGTEFWFVGDTGFSPDPRVSMLDHLTGLLGPYRDVVHFKGKVQWEKVPEVLAESTVCVIPSLWENFPFVCLEAMSAARAVVGSSAGGIAEQLAHGRVGRLVRPGRPEEIADRVLELLGDERLRIDLGRASRERVLSVYNPDTVYEQQMRSYRRAIEQRQRSGPRRAPAS